MRLCKADSQKRASKGSNFKEDDRASFDLGSLVEGDGLVLYEAVLPEVVLALLLLLRVVCRHVGRVAPPECIE